MSIYRINPGLPLTTKLSLLNSMLLELDGLAGTDQINKLELDALYANGVNSRKYARQVGIGNTLATYSGWSDIYDQAGYSIWKYTPSNYTYDATNNVYMNGQLLTNEGQANSESALTFTKVFLFNGDSGSGYIDDTTLAGTTGSYIPVMNTFNDYLYLGSASTFSGAKFLWNTRGSNYTLQVQYWTGSAWVTMTSIANGLLDDTNNFQSNGIISWTPPLNWNTTAVNSSTQYWVRISSTTNPITTAIASYIIPATSVVGLLSLSSTDILQANWKWCSYNGNIYVTLQNNGVTTTEGDVFITSSSSTQNKQNFFVYNNIFTADYVSSTFNPVQEVSSTYNVQVTDTIILCTAPSNFQINLPVAHGNEGLEFVIKKVNSTNTVTIACQSGGRIDGATTKTLTTQYSFYRIVSDGANWYIIGGGGL